MSDHLDPLRRTKFLTETRPAFLDALARLSGLPEPWAVPDYIREEVERQGHDLGTEDGQRRVEWMTEAWSAAAEWSKAGLMPSIEFVITLGRMIEPDRNFTGLRDCHVRVGSHLAPPPSLVPALLETLLDAKLSVLDWYKEFQRIHPFRDGNGRTGKILLNWMSGTLDAPIFPPADLFGHPIRNP